MTFSFTTIKNFDDHIKKSIQGYDILDNQIISFANWFLEDDTNVYDIGCSTGRQLRKLKQSTNKRIKYYGIENNYNFTKELKKELDIELIEHDLNKDFEFKNASMILSIFTLQFLWIKNKQNIINNIYKGLNRGGAFVFAEKIYSATPKLQDIFTFQSYDYKRPHFSSDEILDKEQDLRYLMKLLTLEENWQLLKNAGFEHIDICWKQNNFICFIAIK